MPLFSLTRERLTGVPSSSDSRYARNIPRTFLASDSYIDNISEWTSTPDTAGDIGNDDQPPVEHHPPSGAQRPFSRRAPPPPIPSPRTAQGLQTVHAIGFHPKEAQRAAWMLDDVLGAGGIKRRVLATGPVQGRAGVGDSGNGGKDAKVEMKTEEKPRLLAGPVQSGVSTVQGGGEVRPEEPPRLFSESVGSYISDFTGEEAATSPEEESRVFAGPVESSSAHSKVKGEKEKKTEEPRLFDGAVGGSFGEGGDVEEEKPKGKPCVTQSRGRRLSAVAGVGKVDAYQAPTHPATESVESEDRNEQAMESLWDFASKRFEQDDREVRGR